MKRHNSLGFTIVEIIVVLLLMTILAATLIGRGATPTGLNLRSATDKMRSQIRYVQAQAMKRSDTVWGIRASGTEYWAFRGTDTPANEFRIPGGDYVDDPPPASPRTRVREADLNASVSDFVLVFDRIGKPYTAYTSATVNTPLSARLPINLTADGSATIQVEPETGFVR